MSINDYIKRQYSNIAVFIRDRQTDRQACVTRPLPFKLLVDSRTDKRTDRQTDECAYLFKRVCLFPSPSSCSKTDGRTDGRTDRQTDRRVCVSLLLVDGRSN